MHFVSTSVIFLLFTALSADALFMCPEKKVVITPEEFNSNPAIINGNLSAGYTIKLDSGAYNLTDHIVLPDNSCLLGSGPGDDGTKLVATGSNSDSNNNSNDGVLRVENSKNVLMRGFSLNITNCTSDTFCKYIVKVKDSKNVTFHKLILSGGVSDSVFITESFNVSLRKVGVSNSNHSCVSIKRTDHVMIIDSHASSCVYHGFAVEDGSSITLKHSSVMEVGKEHPLPKVKSTRQYHGSGAYFIRVSNALSASSSISPATSVTFSDSPSSTVTPTTTPTYTSSASVSPSVTVTTDSSATPIFTFAVTVKDFKVAGAYYAGVWAKDTTIEVSDSSVTVEGGEPNSCFRVDNTTSVKLIDNECGNPKKCLRIDDGSSHTYPEIACGEENMCRLGEC